MKRTKKLTKKERKALNAATNPRAAAAPSRPHQHEHEHQHIHCIVCGKHLDPDAFGEAGGPEFYRCQHGSDFAHCAEHAARAKVIVDEHDRTGQPVQIASAWH